MVKPCFIALGRHGRPLGWSRRKATYVEYYTYAFAQLFESPEQARMSLTDEGLREGDFTIVEMRPVNEREE